MKKTITGNSLGQNEGKSLNTILISLDLVL